MPLVGVTTATTTTTTATMEVQSNWEAVSASQSHDQINHNELVDTINSLSSSIDHKFNESQCLFCHRSSSDLDHNLEHMSKSHGLHIVTLNLLVDIESLLAYFHLVISSYHECLYCGTQRNTRQAVQQHMTAKGHCKYDLTAKDAEFREFYDLSALEAEKESQRNLIATRISDIELAAAHDKSKKPRSSKRWDKHNLDITFSQSEHGSASSGHSSAPPSDSDTSSDGNHTLVDPLRELSIREQKRAYTLNNQLSQFRAGDRRSLMHLPISQQRTILVTYHKQMEKARRSEQTQRGNLESAGNSFARLGTIRLIRKPPHIGRVQTLKR
jgi:pre-60S factor REI1